MKVIAYKCDLCGRLMNESDAIGLAIIMPDLFKGEYEYKSDAAHKCELHFCTDCHQKRVVDLVKNINRAKKEEEYTYLYNLYAKKFYELIHRTSLFFNNPKDRRRR